MFAFRHSHVRTRRMPFPGCFPATGSLEKVGLVLRPPEVSDSCWKLPRLHGEQTLCLRVGKHLSMPGFTLPFLLEAGERSQALKVTCDGEFWAWQVSPNCLCLS